MILKRKLGYSFPTILFLVLAFNACTHAPVTSTTPVETPPSLIVDSSKVDTRFQFTYKSMIRSFLEDSKGNLWIGSDREGICKYDGKVFTYFKISDGLSHHQIRDIQEGPNGDIWLRTGNLISRYDGKKWYTPKSQPILPGMEPANNWQKTPNDLWVGDGNQAGGIYRFDGKALHYLTFPQLDRDHPSFSIDGPVTGICYGQDNTIWIASYGGVLGYNEKGFRYINEKEIDAYHVRSIFEDSQGRLWIGNNGIGVLMYDGKTTISLSEIYDTGTNGVLLLGEKSAGSVPNHVFAIAEDPEGNIWIGDRDTGAWRYDGKKLRNFTMEDGLSNNFVRAIYQDKKGEMWFGLDKGHICQFNGVSFQEVF